MPCTLQSPAMVHLHSILQLLQVRGHDVIQLVEAKQVDDPGALQALDKVQVALCGLAQVVKLGVGDHGLAIGRGFETVSAARVLVA